METNKRKSIKTSNTTSVRNLMDHRAYNNEDFSSVDGVGYDDDESFFTASNNKPQVSRHETLVRSETRIILAIRVMIVVILVVTGAMTTATLNLAHEQVVLANDPATEAARLVHGMESNLVHMLQVMDDAASELSARGGNDWPFVTLDDFDALAGKKRVHAGLDAMFLLPVVEHANLPAWQNYTTARHSDNNQADNIRYLTTGATVNETGTCRMLPLSQSSPAALEAELYSTDMTRIADFSGPLEAAVTQGDSVIGPTFDPWSVARDFVRGYDSVTARHDISRIMDGIKKRLGTEPRDSEPYGTLLYPIISANQTTPGVVAILGATFRWSSLIGDSGSSQFLVAVEKNGTSLPLSFMVDGGQAIYTDAAAMDDTNIHVLVAESSWSAFASRTSSAAVLPFNEIQSCFSIRLYSIVAKSTSAASGASLAALVAIMFSLILALYSLYDHIVQRRQKEVHEAAVRSNKIVTSLFPNQVADRLFAEDTCSNIVEQDTVEEFQVKANFLSQHDRKEQGLIKEPANHKLKHVLKDNGHIYDDLVTNHTDKPVSIRKTAAE